MKRSMSPKLRWLILERDRFACVYCGRGTPDGVKLVVDHVTPVAADGTEDEDNLVAACEDCNNGKSDRMPVLPKHAADALVGAVCPTRLRIAAIAEWQDVGYRYALELAQEELGDDAPPYERNDRRWVAVVRSERDRFTFAVSRIVESIYDKSPLAPFVPKAE